MLRATLALSASAYLPINHAAAAVDSTINERMAGDYVPVHDPCIIKADGLYHLFATGHLNRPGGLIPWRVSSDLVNWRLQGSVFDSIPAWAVEGVPGINGLWAPDIAYVNGRYHLYYSCSTFGSNRSTIALATTPTLDRDSAQFHWQDHGPVIQSHQGDDFNAIDPNYIVDRDGKHWIVLGSFWSGIKLFEIDPSNGMLKGNGSPRTIATRPVPQHAPAAIEAPFLIERVGFYYLFVSFDYCCKGERSTYYIVVGRSQDVTGPFVGRDGKSMMQGYGTVVVRGNSRFAGVGHCAVLRDPDQDYLVYHAYDSQQEGRPVLRISPVSWDSDGWPDVTH